MEQNNENKELSFPGTGQAGNASADQATPAEGQQGAGSQSDPKPLFNSQADLDEWAAALEDQIFKKVQGHVDSTLRTQQKKVEAAVNSVKAQIKAAKDAGQTITPEAEQAMIKAAEAQARQPEQGDNQQQPSSDPSATQASDQEPVTRGQDLAEEDVPNKITELKSLIGQDFMIWSNDEEAPMVVMDKGPKAYVDSLQKAMLAKRDRLSSAAGGVQSPGGGTFGGNASGIQQTKDPGTLITQGLKNLDSGKGL